MKYKMPLSKKQVHELSKLLTEEQYNFIEETIKQNRKSKWLEIMARHKGKVIDENMTLDQIIETINDWILIDILDGGYGQRPYKCECGTSIRYQYIVEHKKENKVHKLGSTCIQNYTGIPAFIIKDINTGFHHINLERDDILIKYKQKEFFDIKLYKHLDIKDDIKRQVGLKLPLSNRQIRKI